MGASDTAMNNPARLRAAFALRAALNREHMAVSSCKIAPSIAAILSGILLLNVAQATF